jgi:hypothetical protein
MSATIRSGPAETKAVSGRLGLIATGQGPRNDYITFHQGFLRSLGLEVEILLKCMLDGRTAGEIAALAPEPSDTAIHGYVRRPGSMNRRFGPDWAEVWMTRASTIPLVQACIDDLEREHVDAIIYCCAENYPDRSFRTITPFILPGRVLLKYAELVAATRDHTTIGILTSGARQRPQQLEAWQCQSWASRVTLHYELLGDRPVDAAAGLASLEPHLVLYWGYGVGLAPGDPTALLSQLEAVLQRPIILPHIASTLLARNFLRPSLNASRFLSSSGRC